jgi:hypothetical protein
MTEWLDTNLARNLLTVKMVADTYKISPTRQYQLINQKCIPGYMHVGSVHLYLAHWAVPWFDAYVAKQTARASTREAKKTKPVRAPRLAKKDQWRKFTWAGQELMVPEGMQPEAVNEQMFTMIAGSFGYTLEQWQKSARSLPQYEECLVIVRQWTPIYERMKALYAKGVK